MIILVITLIMRNSEIDADEDLKTKDVFPIFRGTFIISFYFLLFSLNVYSWEKFRINARRVF